jgi:transcriptional regulator with XRE-family HTH domain
MSNLEKKLPERILEARKYRRLSQEQLAELADLNRVMISKYETGATVPTLQTLTKLANALNTTTDYLLGLSDKLEQHTRVFTTDSMRTLAAHQSNDNDAPITEARLNEILKRAFDEYDRKRNQ